MDKESISKISFKKLIKETLTCGYNYSTIAVITGGLFGALFGLSNVPEEFI